MEPASKPRKEEWSWINHKPNNMLNVVYSSSKDFYKWWCTFVCPFVHLTPREIDLVASLLKERAALLNRVKDPEIADTLLMSDDVRSHVLEECNITLQYYYVLKKSLMDKRILLDSGINPQLIPNVREGDNGNFQLLVLFRDKNTV